MFALEERPASPSASQDSEREWPMPAESWHLVYLAIADAIRPRWLVWENVPGVLSSDEGRDFGAIIGGNGQTRVWPVAWRVLDAQYFGVPQRRRRVFSCRTVSGDWRR